LSPDRIRAAIVGCGDAAHRHYLPPLTALADRVEIVGASDARLEAAARVAESVASWSPDARAFDSLDAMLADTRPHAVFNLTPAPLHAGVTEACLAAGAHVYSEKPLAATVARSDELIAAAEAAGLLLMCAPASAVTRHVRWLNGLVHSGRLGRATLVLAQCGNMGPAAWLEYTGDPTVFYGPSVGPVLDLGIYRLHEMTSILGPIRRVQAMGKIAIPERKMAGGRLAGRTMTVTAPDNVLIHLEFASGALGQLLASFALPATQQPWLEIHLESGSISLVGDAFSADSPADVFMLDGGAAHSGIADVVPGFEGLSSGWNRGLLPPPPADPFPLIGMGAGHFIACISGEEKPLLTAAHARHVLDVVLRAYESIADGTTKEISTTF
jgi:predicted dehydrogenase